MNALEIVLLVLALVVAVTALIVALWLRKQHIRLVRAVALRPKTVPAAAEPIAGQQLAFVANPIKPDVAELLTSVKRACASLDLPEPLWFETTAEDPGGGQTKAAIKQGADVVVAVGGDGTVREVADALSGTGIPMAILPLGTGNLLARNLDIPIADLEDALLIAIEGRDRTIDVGRLRILEADEEAAPDPDVPGSPDGRAEAGSEHIFLVISGLGFDAAMVADANTRLKAKMGWVAYFVAGIRHLHGRRLEMKIELDDHEPVLVKGRTILMGNCGRLPGGLVLMPDAELDDGILDVAAIDTRGGIAGWAQLFGEVVMQGFGVSNDLPNKIGRIDHTQCTKIRVTINDGEQVQVDGDILGRARSVESWVDEGALVVRVPRRIRLSRNRTNGA